MRIVVTGALGMIGSVVSRMAAERGHTVFAVDDGSRGLNVPPGEFPHLTFVQRDLRDGLPDVVGEMDAVVHLAAGTGSLDRPLEQLRELNLHLTQTVWGEALMDGCKAFVFPTTSLSAGVPDSPYVISKDETMQWLRERLQPELIPLRFCNVMGAYKGATERRKKEVHIVPTLVEAHRSGKPFVINGTDYDTIDGTPGRDFVNVADVAEFILRLVESKVAGRDAPVFPHDDGTIWCGTGRVTTALEMVKAFRDIIGPVAVEYGPRRAFDTGSIRCPDGQAYNVRQVLGRAPIAARVSLEQEAKALLEGQEERVR